MRMTPALIAGKIFALALFTAGAGHAAEIKVLASNAMKTTLEELGPQFEKATEHKLLFTFNAAVPLKAEIERAWRSMSPSSARLSPTTSSSRGSWRVRRASTLHGRVRAKRGAPKPDISTTEAFKRGLLDAKSICYVEQGATGIHLKGLFERLGIADQLKGKTKLRPPSNPAAHAVANGEAEIGMTQISEILPYPGAELVGPLPAEIQLSSVYPAAVGTGAKEPDAAKAFIKFLAAPSAIPVLKAKGLEPG